MNHLSAITLITAVARKETRTLLRSRRAFWLLMLTLAVAAGAFLVGMAGGEHVHDLNASALFSRRMFVILGMAQLCIMGLVTPLITATAFSGEREHKTLDLLYCTAVPRGALLFGKWLAAIVYQFLLVLCLLPVLSLTFQLGGVGLDEYLFSAGLIFLTVATYAMIGLAVSVRARRSLPAMMVALGIVLACGIGLIILGSIVEDIFHVEVVSQLGFYGSPILVFSKTMQVAEYNYGTPQSPFGLFTRSYFCGHFIFQLSLFIVSARYAWWCLRRGEALKPAVARKLIDDPELLARRCKRFPYYLVDPLRRPQDIADRQDPILVKEYRLGGAGRSRIIVRLGYCGLVLSVLFLGIAFSNLSTLEACVELTLAGLSFVLLFAPVLTATVISREREEGTMDLLLTLPLSPTRIVRAKFLSVFQSLLLLAICATLIPLIVQTLVNDTILENLHAFAKSLPVALAFLLLYSAAGVCISAFCRRNNTAIAIAVVVMALMYFTPFVLVFLCETVFRSDSLDLSIIFHSDHIVKSLLMHFCQIISPLWTVLFTYDSDWSIFLVPALLTISLAWLTLRLAAWRLARRKDTL